jgi:enoyl-CoA hydratase/carnithine racemase
MSTGTVRTTLDAGIGWLELHRPEAMNAITIELATDLDHALVALAGDARVVVITGAGGNFCAGGDFRELERLRAIGPDAMAELFEAFGTACDRIATLPVPVVASVRGIAMAGGFELLLASDLVIVSENARIADNHANYGQVPGGGSTQRLPRLVGRHRATSLILTGGRLAPADAVSWGIAHRMVPDDDLEAETRALAAHLATRSPEASARTKRLIRDGLDGTLADGLALERRIVVEHLTSGAAGDGIAAFTQRGTHS